MTDDAQTDDTSHLGQVVYGLRERRGWSLRDVEEKSGGVLKSSHLSQIENGKVARPGLTILRALADVFGYDFRSFLGFLKLIDDEGPVLGDQEAMALTLFRDLRPAEQAEALDFMQWLFEKRRERHQYDGASSQAAS